MYLAQIKFKQNQAHSSDRFGRTFRVGFITMASPAAVDSTATTTKFRFSVYNAFKESAYVAPIHAGIVAAARKWKLKLVAGKTHGDFVYEGEETTRVRNLPIKPTTKRNYEELMRQLWRFCAIKGDYESMLIMISHTPTLPAMTTGGVANSDNVPAMKVETIEEFIRFKRKNGAIELKRYDETDVVKDIFGVVITTEGNWNNPNQVDIFGAAMTALHCAQKRTGVYVDVCENCCSKTCQSTAHSGYPRVFRHGNPATDTIFKNTMKQLKKDDADYREEGVAQLLPCDVRDLRNNLLSCQSIGNLQTWTIIIVSTLLFLRHDEFHNVTVEAFDSSLFCIRPDRLVSLAVRIKGKCDNHMYTFRIHADNENPDLCPVRALAVYSYLIGIKGGFLFPSEKELLDPPDDGIYKTTIAYTTFMAHLKTLCTSVLRPRPGIMQVGCHTFRKTGYCLAIFGAATADDPALMRSARHKSPTKAATYIRDACSNYAIHLESPNPENVVSKWKSTIVQSSGTAGIVSQLGGNIPMEFVDVGKYFVTKLMRILPNNPMSTSSMYLMNAAKTYIQTSSADERLQAVCDQLSPTLAMETKQVVVVKAMEIFDELLRTRESNATHTAPPSEVANNPAPAKKARTESVEHARAPSESHRNNKNNLDERNSLKHLTTAKEKIQCMQRIEASKPPSFSNLTTGAKSFVSRSLTPTLTCLSKCFKGDVDAFCIRYPTYTHTTFKHCCPAPPIADTLDQPAEE